VVFTSKVTFGIYTYCVITNFLG